MEEEQSSQHRKYQKSL